MKKTFRGLASLVVVLILVVAPASCAEEESVSGPASTTAAEAPDPPNIIFVLADDLDASLIEDTPGLNALLADEGTTFENAFVTHSLCCPSRSSILRGQYTHNHQVLGNGPLGGFKKFHEMGHEDSNVVTWLQNEGYRTVLIGKYLNGYPKQPKVDQYPTGVEPDHVPPGWDEWYAHLAEGTKYYDYQLNENGEIVAYGNEEEDYATDVMARKATEYIERTADDSRPFFMHLSPNAPHDPYTPAPRHEGEFADAQKPHTPSFNESDLGDKPSWLRDFRELSPTKIAQIDEEYRARLRMMLSVEEMISGVVEALEATGKLENTYIVFTSDNGYHLGEHRRRGKETAYEEDVHVPLFVRGPGVPAGRVADEFALNIDLAPTFAEMAGASAPDYVDGRSLVPLLNDDAPPETWRSAFLLEHWNEYAQAWMVPDYKGLRTAENKYVEYATGDRELYDMTADPYELESLHDSADPELVAQLQARIEALRDCAGESCRAAEDASP